MTLWIFAIGLAAPPRDHAPVPPAARLYGPDLPLVATDRVDWTSRTVQASFAPMGVAPVRAELVLGGARYAGAWKGADLEYRWIEGGFEDLVTFWARPAVEELTYDLAVGNAAGLRLVADTLELLDAGGAPRLRVRPPFVVDAAGRHEATLEVHGCDVDRSPVAPWGRPVVAPGATHCTVVVRWANVTYPATVDPAWVDGGLLVTPRNAHSAALMGDGRVLIAGGYDAPFVANYTDNAEIYDPATNTYAATLSMNHPRGHHGSMLLPDGTVLVAPGDDVQDATAEIFNPATGLWADTAPMVSFRDLGTWAALPDGRFLAIGGVTSYDAAGIVAITNTAEIYDPDLATWSQQAVALSSKRTRFAAAALEDSRVVAAGGCTSYSGFTCMSWTDESDVFDPVTNTWSATADLPYAVDFHTATRLGDGRVLLAGGFDGVGASYALRAALFDPVTETWSLTASASDEHVFASMAVLPDGSAVIGGSWGTAAGGFNMISAKVETFDPVTETWTKQPSMYEGRAESSATPLLDGRVLWAGGAGGSPTFDHEVDNGEIFDQSCEDLDRDKVCADVDLCLGFDDRLDLDLDAIPDDCDNCEIDSNVDQADADGDGIGDSCDVCPDPSDPSDSDGDGACDFVDVCAGYDDALDVDADGVPTGCDPCPRDVLDDSDGDTVCDEDDVCNGADDFGPNSDADVWPDACDLCPEVASVQVDFDEDAFGNECDCAPTDPERYPGATEYCDGTDEDCDGAVDNDPVDARLWYRDADGDGQGDPESTLAACAAPDGYVELADDCDDVHADARVGGTEVCNGYDDDCDGVVDPAALCPADEPTTCGCAGGGASGWGSASALVVLLLLRRRLR